MNKHKLNTGREVSMLDPGVYKLTRDVKNPEADKRSPKDWHKRPTFAAGDTFVIVGVSEHDIDTDAMKLTEEERAKIAKIKVVNYHQRIQRAGSKGYNYLHSVSEAGQALIAALEPTEESWDAFVTRLDFDSYHLVAFLGQLVDAKLLTRSQLEEQWNTYAGPGEDR